MPLYDDITKTVSNQYPYRGKCGQGITTLENEYCTRSGTLSVAFHSMCGEQQCILFLSPISSSSRSAMSMLYLGSSIATSTVRLSGRSAASRSSRVLTFHCAIVSSCLLLLPS